MALKDLIAKCEADIRAGRGDFVARRIAAGLPRRIPRDLRLPLANVCRRAGLNITAMKVLTPTVVATYAEGDPGHGELAEYGMLLQKTGAANEALRTLKRVDSKSHPEALLYMAICHFSRWEEAAAIPVLQSHLRADLSEYWRCVGHVNLASALLGTERYAEAAGVLEATLATARAEGFKRTEGNCLELRAQMRIKTGALDAAESDLEAAATLLRSLQTNDALYVSKWRAVLESMRERSCKPLRAFREQARQRRDWESVREADRYMLGISFKAARFDHLLFGTPFECYRRYLVDQFGRGPSADSYILGERKAPRLVVTTGAIGTRQAFNPGKTNHRVLEILTRDFYKPVRLGSLHSELFPGEHFDIFSSPDRVHQVLRRTRRHLERQRLPLEIKHTAGDYSLLLKDGIALEVPYDRRAPEGQAALTERLAQMYSDGRGFTAREAREKLGISRTSFQRLVHWAVDHGWIQQSGERNRTRYKINKRF